MAKAAKVGIDRSVCTTALLITVVAMPASTPGLNLDRPGAVEPGTFSGAQIEWRVPNVDDCIYINPWTLPPTILIEIEDCLPPVAHVRPESPPSR